MSDSKASGGPIAWMATNSIAANLAMLVLIIGGLLLATRITQEVFPEFDIDTVTVRVPYIGASPEEIEQGILLALEDRTRGIDGVKKVRSQALEGVGTVTLELVTGADRNKALQDVKNEVDRIITFPAEAEEPVVSLADPERTVMSVIVYGDVPETSLRALAERVRDDLIAHPAITLVELGPVPDYEIAVEVPEANLRAYGLSLPAIADRIRTAALELPGGEVNTTSGDVLLRTQERRDLASEFSELPIVTTPDGTPLRVQDLGDVVDGFSEANIEATYNGLQAIELFVQRVGDETPIAVAAAAREVVETTRASLPSGIDLVVWNDQSLAYSQRLDLLGRNALLGLGLVLLLLGLFLEPRVAFWVTMGIVISVVGSFLVFPATNATINMVSLFAFIVTLGIVVDDAIIVGENIFEKRERGMPPLQAAIEGAREISGPVVFAVLTNITAFMPLFFVPGASGNIFRQIPAVVVSVFVISLLESLYILPAHLAHAGEPGRLMRIIGAPNRVVTKLFDRFSASVFGPLVTAALRARYLVPAIAVGLLLLTVGVIGGGLIRMSFLPRIDSDLASATARLPVGVPVTRTREVRAILEETSARTEERLGGGLVEGVFSRIGGREGSANDLTVQTLLVPPEERTIGGIAYNREWRQVTGDVTGVEALTFSGRSFGPSGAAIDFQLTGPDQDELESAAREIAAALRTYSGVSDIDDGTASGKRQLSVKLTDEGRSAGLTSDAVANQIRGAFYGAEALRQQRGRNEVKVLVRLPREERERLSTVENLVLRTPDGGEMPLSVAATLEEGRSYTTIDRVDGRRVVSVTGEVDTSVTDAESVLTAIADAELGEILDRYEGVAYSLEGEQESQRESMVALGIGLAFAVFAIFAMLAIPLGSYTMPVIVLSGAPFGVIGALLGHFVLGYGVSLMSLFGIIALTGVVVNDSLVLVITANRYREEGMAPFEAVRQASIRRLRPILLTSMTTSMGLLPIMLETSTQARFLIPMAISLGFGVLFSTLVILLLVPSLYLIREEFFDVLRVARGREPRGLHAPDVEPVGS
ncbi:MAG: efflux RND transporter permease subunit [Planctomycetota bacterium]